MDLLGGYGSDGSSDDETNHPQVPLPLPPPQTTKPAASISKRGKKLVSLHAVLPPHILEQLTKGGEDSDDDEPMHISAPKAGVKPAKTAKRGADEGLTSLLSELSSFPKITVNTNDTAKLAAKPEKMGHAFLQTQTTVVSKAKQEIVDIHKPHAETVDENENDYEETRKRVATMTSSISPAPTRHVTVSVPRPAFGVQPARQSRTTHVPSQTYDDIVGPANQEEHVEESMDPRLAKKRSRREIEKALRSGDLNAIDGHDGVHSLDGDSNVYVPEQETYMAQKGTGVRIAPVAMYDTKAGKDVVGGGVSGKARGKNQINHLMASAAAFEANQAQQAKVKTNRANAKRKYGW